MNGILTINKPSGITSHDVVARARGILHERRIGHTGTLDPLATGVLVLCVGSATRIAQFLEAGEKEYRAIMRLGVTTDTLDAQGSILRSGHYTPPDRQSIIDAMKGFIGPIMQRPPAYSAIKVAGVPSYKLARKGNAVVLAPRRVTLSSVELTAYEDPYVHFSVRCSKGFYIRTLCADLGDVLGMGAHLSNLKRTRSGRFTLQQAITLEQLHDLVTDNREGTAITSIDDALDAFPAVPVNDADAIRIQHGNRISLCNSNTVPNQSIVRIHNNAGSLLAIGKLESGLLSPEIVFSGSHE